MKTTTLFAALTLALLSTTAAQAATILSAKAMPAVTNLPPPGYAAMATAPYPNQPPPPAGPGQSNLEFAVKYFNNETFACGARLVYSDGVTENIQIKQPQAVIYRTKWFSAPGNYVATLSGFAHSGLVACLGSQSTFIQVNPALPAGTPGGQGEAAAAEIAPARPDGSARQGANNGGIIGTKPPQLLPPDLAMLSLAPSKSTVNRMELFKLNFSIKNTGTVAVAHARIRLTADYYQLNDLHDVGALNAGETRSGTIDIMVPKDSMLGKTAEPHAVQIKFTGAAQVVGANNGAVPDLNPANDQKTTIAITANPG